MNWSFNNLSEKGEDFIKKPKPLYKQEFFLHMISRKISNYFKYSKKTRLQIFK
jgi:hypothetical protein